MTEMTQDDRYNLQRFVDAQNPVYASVLAELRRGKKTTHWIWFIFPQVKGLDHSATANFYALDGEGEARAFFEHGVLGPRLLECTNAVLSVQGRSVEDIFGFPDHLKFGSCMTLFSRATRRAEFATALETYFGGKEDEKTVRVLGGG